ncbi:MAG TPA: tripartite tricarboxylate transporter substrate binding protein [Usitatibacter sp.]|nr:tripartite tricarboxylate transporter substrate binding protein [Usitatibacter sp.]
MKGIIRALAAAAAVAASLAHAQFPQKTVTLVVPYAAGGLPDTVARVVGQKLSEKWGQAVVIENKPGGNGVVAAQYMAQKPADGYTLLVTDGSMYSINPFIYRSLPYDPQKDFTFISLTARAPLFLAVPPSLPASNFTEFVQMVKSKPGTYTYGSSGIGSIHHLTMESIKGSLGIDLLHVPFKGTGQSIPALVSGQVTGVFSAMPSLAGFVKEGKLKLIAVNSEKRSSLAPDVATIAETTIPGFDFAPTIGFAGPAGIPPAVVTKISNDVADAVKDPALKERLSVLGIDAVGGGPQEYAAQVAADRVRFEKAVKLAGAKAD